MSTGAPVWHPLKVEAVRLAARGMFHLHLSVKGTPLDVPHRPGQYVKVRQHDGADAPQGFFAIASGPSTRGRLELLIKAAPGLAEGLTKLPVGAEVQVSDLQGKGFPLEAALGKNLLLFATGSGISPIRSVLELIRERRAEFGECTLFFGARTPDAFAYLDEQAAWEKAGIRVLRTVSQPGEAGWTGLTGYVQTHLHQVRVDNAVALLCGQKGMVQGVTEALTSKGLDKSLIFLNF